MERSASGSGGPAPFGPPGADPGLPASPEVLRLLTEAAGDADAQPAGGGPAVLDAAAGYWSRRGLRTGAPHVLAASGAQPLLLALLTAAGGDVLLTRPCAAWYAPQIRLLGRPAYHVPAPAECGGVPDPFAFLETVRRIRSEGGEPRVLLLSIADDPSGTVPPPELLRETCEAAIGAGMLIVSDETYRDTLHDPVPSGAEAGTVLLSPAEMHPGHVVVLADLGADLAPAAWPAAVARFPDTWHGGELRTATLGVLAALHAVLPTPVAAAAAYALSEPPSVLERRAAAVRLHGTLAAALYRSVTAAGALCRPPRAGCHLYPDLDPLRGALAARGITDSIELERHLGGRLAALVPGGHRFGDPPDVLRVRLSTGPLLGATGAERLAALDAPDPRSVPHVADALTRFAAAFDDLGAA